MYRLFFLQESGHLLRLAADGQLVTSGGFFAEEPEALVRQFEQTTNPFDLLARYGKMLDVYIAEVDASDTIGRTIGLGTYVQQLIAELKQQQQQQQQQQQFGSEDCNGF